MTRPEAGPKDGFPPGKADTKAPVRVVIIEDSELQKEALRGICEEGEQLQVIATAPTGRAGVEAVLKLQPDLILCDLNLPDIDGFEVITEIMSERATPILVVTASLRPPGRRDAFDALGLGAVDVIEKPNSAMLANETWRERFRQQLRVIARTRVIPHVMGRVRHRFQKSRSEPLPFVKPRLLVIVASAGGPQVFRCC